MSEQLKNVRHDYIRYANCWEDADMLLKGLDIKSGDRVFSIASAGDNSFSLLCGDPELVVAVDINPIQLKLVELKVAAFQSLDYPEFLQFLGFRKCRNRSQLFKQVEGLLSKEALNFWRSRQMEIEAGIISQGKFENYFGTFRKYLLPLIHTKRRVGQLFSLKSAEEQAQFCDSIWFNRRWKGLFRLFFSRWVMGRLGRDPKFLNEVKIPVSTFILNQAHRHLSSVHCQSNYFLHFILKGYFGKDLPHYARPENFELIKSRLDRLKLFKGLAEEALAKYPKLNKFNLSNIFEYMDESLFNIVTNQLISGSGPQARFAYWNLMVPRKMSAHQPQLKPDAEYGKYLPEDCGFFYRDFNVDFHLD